VVVVAGADADDVEGSGHGRGARGGAPYNRRAGVEEGARGISEIRPFATREDCRALYEECLAKKADVRIEPFLRLLYDNRLIDCDGNPQTAAKKTQIKIQKFVYIAQACFGLNFDYRHTLYIYGPHSPTLTNDYHRIRDIRDVPPGRPGSWPGEGEFLDFAKKHDDVDWLEIASTLLYLRKAWEVPMDEVIESAERIKYKFSSKRIKGVLAELQHASLIK